MKSIHKHIKWITFKIIIKIRDKIPHIGWNRIELDQEQGD